MKEDLFICAKNAAPELEPVEGDPQLYRKELIYPGEFVKKGPDGTVEFELPVSDQTLDHWVAAHKRLVAAGIEVPMPIEHTNDPEKRRGTVERIEKEFNPDRGTNSLYMYARFSDPETAKLARTAQVSLYSPSKFVDGTGKTHNRPIRHVALTDYPLIPKLGPWQAVKGSTTIALSESGDLDILPGDTSVEASMTFAELADQLGVVYEEGASDDDIAQMIVEEWNNDTDPLMEDDEELLPDEEELPIDDEEEPPAEEEEEVVDPTIEEEEIPASVSASFARSLIKTRKREIEIACSVGKITPVERDKLVKRYADPRRVAIALSHGDVDDDGYDHTMSLLADRKAVSLGERTLAQQLGNGGENNPVIRDAERRKLAAAKK